MKKLVVVPALVLVLLVSLVGASFAAIQPYDFRDVTKPDGDDHPWGGEQYNDEVVPLKSYSEKFPVITSIGSLDMIFAAYLELFYPQPRQITKSNPEVKNISVDSSPLNEGTKDQPSVVNRGN